MVEGVEHLPTELQAVTLPKPEVLGQSQIPRVLTGTSDDVTSGIPLKSIVRLREVTGCR